MFLSSLARAEFTEDQVRQLEAFATKWERDAATLLGGDVIVGNRWESIGRALGFQRAAADLRLMLNRPIVYTRDTQPQPWPPSDQRGTQRLAELIQPGFVQGVPRAEEPARPAPSADPAARSGPERLGFQRGADR